MPKSTKLKAPKAAPLAKASEASHFDPWLDTAGVAAYTGYHIDTIRRMIRGRCIGASKFGPGRGTYRIRLSELNRWMKSRELKASAYSH